MKFLKRTMAFICCFALCVGSAGTLSAFAEDTNANSFDIISTKGVTAVVSQESYGENNDGWELTLTAKDAGISFANEAMQDYEVFQDVIVDMRLKTSGTGYDGDFQLYKAEGDLIDYGLPGGIWNRVKYRTKIYVENGVKFVKLDLYNGKGKTVNISDISVEIAPEEKPLLGGVKLFSMEAGGLMQGYVLVTPENKVIVIDGGNTADVTKLLSLIRTFTNKVDYWFITHFHTDHAGALRTILDAQAIAIENLCYSFPDTATVKNLSGDADAWLCDAMDELVANHPEKVKNVYEPKAKDVFKVSETVTVKALNDAWFEKNNNYGNNSGVMYKVETPGEDILFIGDMGDRGDYYLEDDWVKKEVESCTVIQMSHHGQNGVTDLFYSTIKEMKVCLYPAVMWIYDNNGGSGFNSATLKTMHTRDLVRERGVMDIYVSGRGRALLE